MKYDHIFLDSGGTLYRSGPGLEPAPAKVQGERQQRVLAALRGMGVELAPERLAAALARQEKPCATQHGHAYTYFRLMVAVVADLGLPLGPELAASLADAYAGPRYAAWLFPGTVAALRQLSEHGYRLGIIANTAWPGFCMDRAFAGVGLLPYLSVRLYSGDLGLAKPDAAIFQLAERYAGVAGRAQRLLYVGNDLNKDIRGAAAVGWSTAYRRAGEAHSGGLANFEFSEIQELVRHCLAD